jgi:hypothetical protein
MSCPFFLRYQPHACRDILPGLAADFEDVND